MGDAGGEPWKQFLEEGITSAFNPRKPSLIFFQVTQAAAVAAEGRGAGFWVELPVIDKWGGRWFLPDGTT